MNENHPLADSNPAISEEVISAISADANPGTSADNQASDLVSLPEKISHDLAGLFALLADKTRLQIVYYLTQVNELNVGKLCDLLKQSQPAVSHHLALMKRQQVIEMRRDGKHNFYRLRPQRAVELRATIGQFLQYAQNRGNWAEFFTGSQN